ncbi:MAG: acyl carrier protein [Gemmatimonadaceae bacterium]
MKPEELVSRVFGVDRSRVSDETSNRTLPEWDSLGHVTLVLEIEATYRIAMSTDDALTLTSVGSIKRFLGCRGVRW